MVPEEILDDQNQDQEQEQGQEQEPNNSESEDITQVYAAKDWHSGELITSDSLDRIEIELEKLSKAYLAKLGEMIPPDIQMNEDGAAGYVPAPKLTDIDKFLKGNGTWDVPANDNDAVTQEVPITDNNEYPILLGKFTTENQDSYTNSVNRTQNSISINPSTGTITASYFQGDGSKLTNLTAANISGIIPTDKIAGATTSTSGTVTIDNETIQINNNIISLKNNYRLPIVTSDDAGKFLRVDEQGNWAAVTIIDAATEGEVY